MKNRIFLFCLALILCCSCAFAEVTEPPYTVSLLSGTPIYAGPGFDYGYVQAVGEDGVYTIVEEGFDMEGEIWGKLKSGIGWVSLRDDAEFTVSLSAGTAIYDGPNHAAAITETISEGGVFTIVEEAWDMAGNYWGKLKSGAGWVSMGISSAYMTTLPAGTAVYAGPGFTTSATETIAEKGVFTIVEEAFDIDGNVWGKLKSGAGWVCLEPIETAAPPIFADYAGEALLQTARRAIVSNSEYAVHIAVIPNEPLSDAILTSAELTEAGLEVGELLLSLGDLPAGKPVVISVEFPGDLTAYGLSFTDASGASRFYTLSLSGYDGSVVLAN